MAELEEIKKMRKDVKELRNKYIEEEIFQTEQRIIENFKHDNPSDSDTIYLDLLEEERAKRIERDEF